MKNLIYVFAIAIMGLVACGTPAEKADCAKDSKDSIKECSAVVKEACAADCVKACCTGEVATDSTVVEEMVTEEVEAESAE